MLLVSVGTGTAAADDERAPGDMNLLYNARSIPTTLLSPRPAASKTCSAASSDVAVMVPRSTGRSVTSKSPQEPCPIGRRSARMARPAAAVHLHALQRGAH